MQGRDDAAHGKALGKMLDVGKMLGFAKNVEFCGCRALVLMLWGKAAS